MMNRLMTLAALCLALMTACSPKTSEWSFDIPDGYLDEREDIPAFWKATTSEVEDYLKNNVKKGSVSLLGTSAGGRPVYSVTYGLQRRGTGTATYSGASSVNKISAFRGEESDKKVYMVLSGVHGFELEGIVGSMNLISVLETGKDLSGASWPELAALADSLDRIVILPLCNPDGRDRVPVRMEKFRGHAPDAFHVHEYLNTGGREGGKLIGWPACKEWVPIPFDKFEFPGSYPNDNGYNLMHDDFFGNMQPENRIIFGVASEEKPDIIMSMHTGVSRNDYFMEMLQPSAAVYPPMLFNVWRDFFTQVHTALTLKGLKKTMDVEKETTPKPKKKSGCLNMTGALAFHCGALSVTVEAPSHGYAGVYDDGTPVQVSPEKSLAEQLTAHQAAMEFLNRKGGVAIWEKEYNN